MSEHCETLSEFLLARIAEDEAGARGEAPEGSWGRGYIIPNNPARVLAECAAKRKIIARLHDIAAQASDEEWTLSDTALVDTLHTMAAVYANHADYGKSWRI